MAKLTIILFALALVVGALATQQYTNGLDIIRQDFLKIVPDHNLGFNAKYCKAVYMRLLLGFDIHDEVERVLKCPACTREFLDYCAEHGLNYHEQPAYLLHHLQTTNCTATCARNEDGEFVFL